ncbi:TOBE domain-containing protein [uncultured Desulfobacter sp.]|uniref:TOBE domain-containing protein n=1 Tax=uncultured Desulfobacter sp. TaxID=240139 RepID=UPI0029F57338|nr:TOBE domain-containing protein [uncultured Desulfobacter sp.]
MTLSARNVIKGTVKEVKKGQVMAEAVIEVAPGVEIASAITTNSVEKLGIEPGKEVTVVIKATSVMLDA